MRKPLHEEANGRWLEILPQLGIPAERLDGKHHPCPICGGIDRFRFADEWTGGWICTHCDTKLHWGVNLVMLKHGVDFTAAAKMIMAVLSGSSPAMKPTSGLSAASEPSSEHDQVEAMKSLWSMAHYITQGSVPERYLINRGIELQRIPDCLRYGDNCLLAQVADPCA